MGIRFHCPHCTKKLNVKSFLAGKRGICPYCDAGLDIPLESEIRNGKATHPTESVEVQTVDSALAAAEAFAEPLTIGGSSAPTVVENRLSGRDSSSNADTCEQTPSAPHADNAKPDPIDENPEAVWYVRPPSGGQFGPAKGDVMRKWLAEGRVSPDALVWREGWTDWQEAEPVFPSLSKRSTPPPPPAAPPPTPTNAARTGANPATATTTRSAPQPTPAAPVATGRAVSADDYASGTGTDSLSSTPHTDASARSVVRRRSNAPALIAIGVLALVCLSLLVGLLIISGAFS